MDEGDELCACRITTCLPKIPASILSLSLYIFPFTLVDLLERYSSILLSIIFYLRKASAYSNTHETMAPVSPNCADWVGISRLCRYSNQSPYQIR